jgi:hypothetical protein
VEHVARIGDMRNTYNILVGNPRRRGHSEDTGVDGKLISSWILRKQGGNRVEWMHLVQSKDKWRALVITVMNLRVP